MEDWDLKMGHQMRMWQRKHVVGKDQGNSHEQ
jgi:hypothetical protein